MLRARPGPRIDPMTATTPPIEPGLAVDTVLELARLEGYVNLGADTAARIAVGAANAVRAVTASIDDDLFDTEPLDYLAELERLADGR
jgi:ribosomal protein L18